MSFVRALWPAFPSLPPELGLGVCGGFIFSVGWAGESSLLMVLHSHVGASLLTCALL